MAMEKLLPCNINAEEGVLGSIILDPEAIVEVVDFLNHDDFYREVHGTIYHAMRTLYEQHEPADFITLCDALARKSKLEDVGGASYITSLVNCVPTSGNIVYYGRIVERTAQLRRLIHAAGKIAAMAYEDVDAESAVSRAEELIHSIGQRKKTSRISSLEDVMGRYLDKLQACHEKRTQGFVSGVPTGFKALDSVLGGLQPSDLIVLAARPAQGKTSLALNIAQSVMETSYQQGYRVLMFSLEMGEEQLARRMVAMETGIDQVRLRTADIKDSLGEWDKIVDGIARLAQGSMWIDDTPALALSDMRSRARRVQTEHGLDLVIVDYMQLMRVVADGKPAENRVQEVSQLSRGLKEVARELNVPVLALAQLSRAVESRADKIPQLFDLRESGTIEQDSDVVMFIHQDKEQKMTDSGVILNIMISKHRNGPCGIIPLHFLPRLTRFSSLEERRGYLE